MQVRCGMCARAMYLDNETYEIGNEAINSGLHKPFRCETSAVEYGDLAYKR